MTETDWFSVEGMIVAASMDPMALAKTIQKQNVVARIDWYDESPQLVGVAVAYDGENIGTLRRRDRTIKPGPTLEEFAEVIADDYKAEVMLGAITVDRFDGDAEERAELEKEDEEPKPYRIVEISSTPASAVPLLAAFEGVDIAELDHSDDRRILMAQLPERRSGWHFGDIPVVTLTMHGDEFKVRSLKDEHFETVASYNWGMNEVTIAGAKGWEDPKFEGLDRILGLEERVQDIFDAAGGVDFDLAVEATKERGPKAVRDFVKALGLPQDVSEYLLGWLPIDLVDNAKLHHARGISNALGRSVDILIDERQEGSKFWETYSKIIKDKPWLVPLVAGLEASAGAALLFTSRSKDGKRSGWQRARTGAGVMLLVDSIAELTLAKYTRWRNVADR